MKKFLIFIFGLLSGILIAVLSIQYVPSVKDFVNVVFNNDSSLKVEENISSSTEGILNEENEVLSKQNDDEIDAKWVSLDRYEYLEKQDNYFFVYIQWNPIDSNYIKNYINIQEENENITKLYIFDNWKADESFELASWDEMKELYASYTEEDYADYKNIKIANESIIVFENNKIVNLILPEDVDNFLVDEYSKVMNK